MITMEMLGKIRRMYLRDKLSLHEIAKRTGLSRNTLCLVFLIKVLVSAMKPPFVGISFAGICQYHQKYQQI